MLKAHINAVEDSLLASSRISANAGHSIHKGTPREAFIRDFLGNHLSEQVAIGTGEIIDCESVPNPPPTRQRNQFDIVLYRREYPRLDIGGGICAFLAESVVATIEVKSVLNQPEIEAAIGAARTAKRLQRHVVPLMRIGYEPPGIMNYVVAYDGPAQMKTVHGWIEPTHRKLGIATARLPSGPERTSTPSPSLDGIFVLGRGFVSYDNMPLGFVTEPMRQQNPDGCWSVADTEHGSLLFFFISLTSVVSSISASRLNPIPYLTSFEIPSSSFLP